MKIEMDNWVEFELQDLFEVVYGVNLALVNCVETDKNDPEAIAFVSRTESNNGVSAYVKPMQNINVQPKDTITVAGGGSVLATFLQTQPFYSGRDLYLLYPREKISNKAKLFLVTIIKANKYRYNYGRQANATLPHLQLRLPVTPNGHPDWQWMESYVESLHSKPLTTQNNAVVAPFNTNMWGLFVVGDYFDIHPTKAYTGLSNKDLDDGGVVPFVVNSAANNGIGGFSTKSATEAGNKITFSDTTVGNTFFYQPTDFIGFPHVQGMYENERHAWTRNQLLFLVSILTFTCTGRYSYGRKMTRANIASTKILLPVTSEGDPDWQWMEDYIDSLPYGDRLK